MGAFTCTGRTAPSQAHLRRRARRRTRVAAARGDLLRLGRSRAGRARHHLATRHDGVWTLELPMCLVRFATFCAPSYAAATFSPWPACHRRDVHRAVLAESPRRGGDAPT